jgi:hypothetical protein
MTAEIAIVNRAAVTLAADSAMTLSVGGARKIYTSTDKIFELSEKDPIGLMIYNNLEFMGAPLDVLVKHFRSSSYCKVFDELPDAAAAFFEYLSDQWKPSAELQRNHARQLLVPAFRRVRRAFDRAIPELLSRRKSRNIGILVYQTFMKSVQTEISKYEQLPAADCFSDTTEDTIREFYKGTLDELISTTFSSEPLEEEEKNLLCRLGVLVLHRNSFSSLLSGLVFAGFGRNSVFPSLIGYHIDGIIADKLKITKTDEEATSRDTIYAKILPFAQREVVDRFLVGIDPDLEDGIANYIESIYEKTRENIFKDLRNLRGTSKDKILNNLQKSLGSALADFRGSWLQPTKERYQQQTEDMVLFMAKQELAHLAEALVNITSLKRKFSAGEETVAGPIDVAVISKNDGFVWVKRKHYFPSELNPRYFVRKFGIIAPPNGDQNAAS